MSANTVALDEEFDNLTQRESHALCLNRRLAPHRIILISWLLETKLFDKTKTSVFPQSAEVWAKDRKRKQPIYLAISPKTTEEHNFPDITLDYIMEL